MRHRGRLTEWNDARGFGFVTSLEDDSRAFVHVSAFPHELRRPQVLDLLSYETQRDDHGRLQAVGVDFLTAVRHRDTRPPAGRSGEIPVWLPLGVLAAILLAAVALRGGLGLALAGGYALMSAITFLAYAADKSAAQHGRFRTQESALHLLEILGGWPGALCAQRLLRHKTVKQSFQAAFWICVVVNVGALIVVVGLVTTSVSGAPISGNAMIEQSGRLEGGDLMHHIASGALTAPVWLYASIPVRRV